MKRKVSSLIITTLLLIVFLLCCYLAREVAQLYQQHQKAARFNGYLGQVEEVISLTRELQAREEGLGEQYSRIKFALSNSLDINLKHGESEGFHDV